MRSKERNLMFKPPPALPDSIEYRHVSSKGSSYSKGFWLFGRSDAGIETEIS